MSEPLSARNPRVKRLGLISRKASARRESGVYLIEGFTLVADAIDAGVELESVYVEAGSDTGAIVEQARSAGIQVLELVERALKGVVDARSPQPVAAIARRPQYSLDDTAGGDFVVVLAGVADPGNVGTILRTAEAAGAQTVVCSVETADPFSPKCVRASAGAIFRLPVVTDCKASTVLDQLSDAGFQLFGASAASQADAYDQVDLRPPLVLVLGNEAHGLAELESRFDQPDSTRIAIPMMGGTESLNVAMAATVICFELARQRRG